jgi:ribose 5-phosphate isomerase B
MKIAIGTDHAGFRYKEEIKRFLKERGHQVIDFGAHSEEPSDYPLFIRPVAEAVATGKVERGVVLGGSGNGEAMVANRVRGIRCALCWNQETALLARKHNDANVLSLGARMISLEEALAIVTVWLDTPFDGGRHLRRIQQIDRKIAPKTPSGSLGEKKPGEISERRPKRVSERPNKSYDLLIAFRYIKYIEGDHFLELKMDPGLKRPSIVHVPSSERWQREMEDWARDRREEIIERIKKKMVHLECEWKEF